MEGRLAKPKAVLLLALEVPMEGHLARPLAIRQDDDRTDLHLLAGGSTLDVLVWRQQRANDVVDPREVEFDDRHVIRPLHPIHLEQLATDPDCCLPLGRPHIVARRHRAPTTACRHNGGVLGELCAECRNGCITNQLALESQANHTSLLASIASL